MSETDLLRRVMIAASRSGARLFRNSVGYDRERRIRYGLYPGSSDLIGWTPVVVPPHWAGRSVAVFTAIEVKAGRGVPSEAQANFLSEALRAGGVAFVATDPAGIQERIAEFMA